MKKPIQIITAASLLAANACAPDRRGKTPNTILVEGADGQHFRSVRPAGRPGMDGVSNPELWQRIGSEGKGRPAYIKKLEPGGINDRPIFIRVGDF